MTVPSQELQRRMERFEQACLQHGLKRTHQRTEIFRELARAQDHPDTDAVYRRVHKRLPAVSLDTVYRTLALLEQLGLVRRAEVRSGPARYDANTDRHHHFVCTRCGLVRDFVSATWGRLRPPVRVRSWGDVEGIEVQVRGTCRQCKAKSRQQGRGD